MTQQVRGFKRPKCPLSADGIPFLKPEKSPEFQRRQAPIRHESGPVVYRKTARRSRSPTENAKPGDFERAVSPRTLVVCPCDDDCTRRANAAGFAVNRTNGLLCARICGMICGLLTSALRRDRLASATAVIRMNRRQIASLSAAPCQHGRSNDRHVARQGEGPTSQTTSATMVPDPLDVVVIGLEMSAFLRTVKPAAFSN